MKTVAEMYPDYYGGYGPGSYQPIIDAIGEILLQVDDTDYQGDSRILYKSGDRIGYLQFGWGSCSGCDALRACDTVADIQQLADSLERETKWFESKAEALEFFKTHNWGQDYSWWRDEQKEFIRQAIKILEA